MSKRHAFYIIYAEGTSRRYIKLHYVEGYDCLDSLQYQGIKPASNREFEWYEVDENDNWASFEKTRKQENEHRRRVQFTEARDYAMDLARQNGIEYVVENNSDGILD